MVLSKENTQNGNKSVLHKLKNRFLILNFWLQFQIINFKFVIPHPTITSYYPTLMEAWFLLTVHIENVRAAVSSLRPEKPVFSRAVCALKNFLTLDNTLPLTRCRGASAVGVLLLDTVVCLTN